jgi:hypothetical protein
MKLKIRIRTKYPERGTTCKKPYVVHKVGKFGFWYKNDFNQLDYAEFKDCDQLVGKKWDRVE